MFKPMRALILCLLLSFSAVNGAQNPPSAAGPVDGSPGVKGSDVTKKPQPTPAGSSATEKKEEKKDEPSSFTTLSVKDVSPELVAWGEEVRVTLNNDSTKGSLSLALDRDKLKADQLELTFNGVKIAKGATVGTGVQFRLLKESDTIRNVWEAGGRDWSTGRASGPLTISFPGGAGQLASSAVLSMQLYQPWQLTVSWVILGVLLLSFLLLAAKSDIVRDRTGPPPTPPARRTYSLARCQIAFWTFIVLGSYLFIYAVIGDPNTILNPQALVLLGIGTGTMLGASIIEVGKANADSQMSAAVAAQIARLQAELQGIGAQISQFQQASIAAGVTDAQKLAAVQALTPLQANLAEKGAQLQVCQADAKAQADQAAPVSSKNVLMDLLTDSTGVSIHRFQMLVWTLVLGFVFLVYVMVHLIMPKLDPLLLTLMGISAGTYLGLKIPEKQTP